MESGSSNVSGSGASYVKRHHSFPGASRRLRRGTFRISEFSNLFYRNKQESRIEPRDLREGAESCKNVKLWYFDVASDCEDLLKADEASDSVSERVEHSQLV